MAHRRLPRLLGALMAVLALGVAAGCGSDDDDGSAAAGGSSGGETKQVKIGWAPPDVTGVFKTATDFFEKGAEDAKKAGFDVEVITRSPTSHNDFADQLGIVEDFIARRVDVIAISPSDTEAIKPALRQANQAGIPVIMVNLLEEQDDIEVASYIGFDNSVAASVSAYAMLDYFGGPGVLGDGEKVDVAPDTYMDIDWWKELYADVDVSDIQAKGTLIEGIAGTFFARERNNGFNEIVSQSGVEMLGKPIAADWNREKGVRAAENFISRYGDDMDFIYASSNEMGLGAVSAAERRDVLSTAGGTEPPEDGKIAVFTNDATPESADAIRAGKIVAETTHGFADWGWFGAQFAVQLACGQEVPKQYDIRPRTMYSGNVDQFYPSPKLPAIDWAKIKQDCK